MAADILVYRATHVPVGEDQKQHLELSRDIAQKFNNDYAPSIHAHGFGEAFFPLPEPMIQGPATRVMSLRDGSKKMSKSEPSDYSRINLTDDADTIAQKIRKAKTDPEPLPSEEKGLEARARRRTIWLASMLRCNGVSKAQVLSEFGGGQFSAFKSALVDLAVAKLGPIGGEMKRLMQDPVYIDSVLADGSDARAGNRRRNHEGGQGHRRVRAAVEVSRQAESLCCARERRAMPARRGMGRHLPACALPCMYRGRP